MHGIFSISFLQLLIALTRLQTLEQRMPKIDNPTVWKQWDRIHRRVYHALLADNNAFSDMQQGVAKAADDGSCV